LEDQPLDESTRAPGWTDPPGAEVEAFGLGELFHRARDAVIVGDASSGRIVLWNNSAAQLFGYTEAEALDLLVEDLVPPTLKDLHRQGLARYAASGRGVLIDSGQVIELPARRKDGSEIQVELTLTPLTSESFPETRFVLAVVRDVTERHRADEKLREALEREREANERLRKLDDLKNQFVAMVAHDLRSPLTSVTGYASLLRQRWKELEDSQRDEFFNAISLSAGRIIKLVDDVLEGAALESGEVPYNIEPFDVAALVRRTIEDMRAAFPEIEFSVEIEEALPQALGDEGRCWQVLTNLLSNAVKFTPVDRPIEVSAQAREAFVHVTVQDHGAGIAPKDVSRLFERFSRVNAGSALRETQSTGLGLFLCRTIVEAQGGRIWVETEPGRGARFTFSLPASIAS
jgi:PAS domain S-box-containing protein